MCAPAYLNYVAALTRSPSGTRGRCADDRAPDHILRAAKKSTESDAVALADLAKRLNNPPEHKLTKELTLDPEEEFLDLLPLGLRVTDDAQMQPRYRLRLEIAAVDGNVETGPGTGASKEKFTIMLVSENELLGEIAKEEESLHVKLEDALNKLKEGRTKLEQVLQELPTLKGDEFSPMTRRSEELQETVVRTWDISQEVFKRLWLDTSKETEREPCVHSSKIIIKWSTKVSASLWKFSSLARSSYAPMKRSKNSTNCSKRRQSGSRRRGAKSKEELDRLIDRLAWCWTPWAT